MQFKKDLRKFEKRTSKDDSESFQRLTGNSLRATFKTTFKNMIPFIGTMIIVNFVKQQWYLTQTHLPFKHVRIDCCGLFDVRV